MGTYLKYTQIQSAKLLVLKLRAYATLTTTETELAVKYCVCGRYNTSQRKK
jgi:hypothetical protein